MCTFENGIYTWGNQAIAPGEIEVCIVGINRVELLELTLHSFFAKLLYQWRDVKVIANIDPFPFPVQDQSAFIEVYKKFFTSGILRFSGTPSFSKAVQWVWGNSTAKVIFHLEDDWICLLRLERTYIDSVLSSNSSSSFQLLLPKMSKSRLALMRGFSLNPMFIDGDWARRAACCLDSVLDPEKQIRHKLLSMPGLSCRTIVYQRQSFGPLIYDTGSHWKKSLNVSKVLDSEQRASWVIFKTDRALNLNMQLVRNLESCGPLLSFGLGVLQRTIDIYRRLTCLFCRRRN